MSETEYQNSPVFNFPKKPDVGSNGYTLQLKANYFPLTIQISKVFHYDVTVIPERCSRKICYEVIKTMINSYKNTFGDLKPVYDGKKNMYTRNLLHAKDVYIMEFDVTLPGTSVKEDRFFKVILKYHSEIDLKVLNNSLNPNLGYPIPDDCLQALDAIIRYSPSLKYTMIGRSFLSPSTEACGNLGGGREIWFGFYQSVQPSYWKVMLNIDVSASAFHKSISVIEFLWEVLGVQNSKEKKKFLTESERQKFAKEIKGLKIEVTHSGTMRRKYRINDVTKCSAHNQTFRLHLPDGHSSECTVEKYFYDRYNWELSYPDLPCLQVGHLEKDTYLPLEVCCIYPEQRCLKKLTDKQTNSMIEVTAHSAPSRQKHIQKLIEKNSYSDDPYMKEFGLHVSTSMFEVKGRVLPPPSLQYGGQTQTKLIPSKGVWDMRDKQFHSGVEIRTWTIVCFEQESNCCLDVIRRFCQQLRKLSYDAGMAIIRDPRLISYAPSEVKHIESLFTDLVGRNKDLELIVVILPGKTKVYAEVKRVGDTVLGVATQCVKSINVTKPITQKISNMCLKINVKLGGINNILVPQIRPKVFSEPIIIMGADVTHPSSGESTKPSVAAVVGSMDGHPSRYTASVRLQPYHQEFINDLPSMIKELLLKFYKSTHFKPVRIILYRNGILDRHLNKVLSQELLAIRQACMLLEAEYKPGITYISIKKRHHTRLFCVDKKEELGNSGNIPPGTTVDSGITQPSKFDFYLCSHAGIQGTSRPCHYHVLWDDNQFNSDELQSLTYQLCYTYARCTRAVSVPAPAYYAHLVASRARCHLVESELENKNDDKAQPSLYRVVGLHKNVNTGMYFA